MYAINKKQKPVCMTLRRTHRHLTSLAGLLYLYLSKSLSRLRLFATPWTMQSVEFSRPQYWSGYPFPSPADLPNPGIKPTPPAQQADSLPAEPQGKPKNPGVGSLSLLQWIFKSNRGILHCRRILYQLSYQGSPLVGLSSFDKEVQRIFFSLQWIMLSFVLKKQG